jgi:hypothetical protein
MSAATQADNAALGILIAARDGIQTPVPRSLIGVASRLQREGHLRITATERVFRISGDGLKELERLEQLGAVPVQLRPVRKKAHEGAETGTWETYRRRRSA